MQQNEENPSARLIILGLDGAGKSWLVNRLRLTETMSVKPTYGFSIATVEHKNLKLVFFEVGGHQNIRPVWHHYFKNIHGIVYSLDCNDTDRFELAKQELVRVLKSRELENLPLLVYGNKIDLISVDELDLVAKLGLPSVVDRNWHLQMASAQTGAGLTEGLDWLAKQPGISKFQ